MRPATIERTGNLVHATAIYVKLSPFIEDEDAADREEQVVEVDCRAETFRIESRVLSWFDSDFQVSSIGHGPPIPIADHSDMPVIKALVCDDALSAAAYTASSETSAVADARARLSE